MNNGFTILEVLIALTISLSVFSVVITSVTDSAACSKKITENQTVLESIFHTVDSLKADLTKCGMRLQEAGRLFDIPIFMNSEIGFEAIMGISTLYSNGPIDKDSDYFEVDNNDYLKAKKKVLIYDSENCLYEFNEIDSVKKSSRSYAVVLKENVKYDFCKNSIIIILKSVSFKYYIKEKALKRKVDRGYFQPMIENVTDFYIKHFPESNSLLYRIEVGQKEQIRGYIFLSNMVEK